MSDQKIKRGKNFLETEKEFLIELIVPHKSIIENIKTDSKTNKLKEATWESILDLFNQKQITGIRTINQIKNVYDSLKRITRKEKSDTNVKIYMDFQKQSLLNSFSDRDKDLLIDIILHFKETLDNEENSELQETVWSEILNLFNSQTNYQRSINEIKSLYEVLQSDARLTQNIYKKSMYKTGGGKLCESTITSGQDKILGFIGDRMEPNENIVDSDTEYREIITLNKQKSINFDIDEELNDFSLQTDQPDYSNNETVCNINISQNTSNQHEKKKKKV